MAEPDAAEISSRLTFIPREATHAYRGVLERMTGREKAFAQRILSWLFHAQRVLEMGELQEALAVQIGSRSLERLSISSPESIVHACGGLVDHNHDTDLVTFSHAMVRQFLEDDELKILSPPSLMTRTCLTYLGYSVFENPCENISELNKRRQEFKLSSYAALFWPVHARTSGRDIVVETDIFDTFVSDKRRDAIAQLRDGYVDAVFGRSLLQFLLYNELAGILMSPLSHEMSIARRYHFSFLHH